jgi:hypothetical protein
VTHDLFFGSYLNIARLSSPMGFSWARINPNLAFGLSVLPIKDGTRKPCLPERKIGGFQSLEVDFCGSLEGGSRGM